MSFATLKGFTDLYGAALAPYVIMEAQARSLFPRYGYEEIRPPILEATGLFQRGIGQDTDVVRKEMFTFADRKGRSLTMRPEATAGVLRAAIGLGLAREGAVARLFTIGPMFRYERPQKGRQRQFHQVNCECLGSASPYADAELIAMLLWFLQSLGISDLSLKLNSLGCRQCRPGYLAKLKEFLEAMPAGGLCDDCERRKSANPLRVLDCKLCQDKLANAPHMADYICSDCAGHFEKTRGLLALMGIAYELDNRLVRGLDYYARTTFEVVSGKIGAQTAVAGGGRYDGLIGMLGGPDMPGAGFACGMERLALLMDAPKADTPDFYILGLNEEAMAKAFVLARDLRAQGFAGEMNYAPASMKSLMRQVARSGAAHCLIIGPDEMASGRVMVKNMATGAQHLADMAAIGQTLTETASFGG